MTILDRLSIYAILGGILVLVAGGLYGRYEFIVRQNTALKAQKAQAEEVAKANKDAFDQLNGRFDRLDKQLAERAKREQALEQKLNGIRRDLNGLKKQDPVVQSWSEQPVPPAISERLRAEPADQGAGGNGQGKAAGEPPHPVPGSTVVRAIERGLVRLHSGAAPAPAGVQ